MPKASNEEEDSDVSVKDEKDMIQKYKSLIAELRDKEESKKSKGDMEISWVDKIEDDGLQQGDEDQADKDMTPWQKYLKKKKDKKKLRKEKGKVQAEAEIGDEEDIPDDVVLSDPFFAEELGTAVKHEKNKKKKRKTKEYDDDDPTAADGEQPPTGLELLVMDSDDEKNHFNYKTLVAAEESQPKKKKWKKKRKLQQQLAAAESDAKPDSFEVDVKDDRFSALFVRPEFNIDPSEPNFKKTKAMEKLIGEKQKRIAENFTVSDLRPSEGKKSRLDPEISSALKVVKNKWKKNAKKHTGT